MLYTASSMIDKGTPAGGRGRPGGGAAQGRAGRGEEKGAGTGLG